ncbi:unnamed protein product [Trichogramma brassicae]|uniref:Uncharacterized protein n=1 Tax=Trichogramma brassicae TaxID=86971 RepID=A0A6H5II25_9HYME|nr:unnamed protein product [Trichogramma brassicae]
MNMTIQMNRIVCAIDDQRRLDYDDVWTVICVSSMDQPIRHHDLFQRLAGHPLRAKSLKRVYAQLLLHAKASYAFSRILPYDDSIHVHEDLAQVTAKLNEAFRGSCDTPLVRDIQL